MAVGMAAQVREHLGSKYVFTDDMARVLSLGLLGKQNVILWGPGGHGKSMMVGTLIDALGLKAETHVQSFGEGMDEAALWGGLNFRKLEEEKVLEYHPERSFLAYRIAIFEELFDAPSPVLLSLKDTLTAKALRKGAQYFPMRTEVIIACTNRDPRKFGEGDLARSALVERFPLQYEVKWQSYTSDAYSQMYRKLGYRYDTLNRTIGELLERLSEQGIEVSPRTAVHAMNAVFAAMQADGDTKPKPAHLLALRFVVGFENHARQLEREIERAIIEVQVRDLIERAEVALRHFGEVAQMTHNPERLNSDIQELNFVKDELEGLRIPDHHVTTVNNLKEQIIVSVRRAVNDVQRGGN